MKLPLLLEARLKLNQRGPEVFLPKGEWRLESDFSNYVVALKSLDGEQDEEQLVSGDVLLLEQPMTAQVVITKEVIQKITIFAVKNGTHPSKS